MTTGIRISLTLALLLLSGCALQSPRTGSDTQAATQDANLSAQPYQPGELNEESLLELITAELAGQQRDFDRAYPIYLKQARLNKNVELAERATRIAQFQRDPEAVIEAARLWIELDPLNTDPAQILINIYLHEARFDEALTLLKQQEQISTELLLVIGSMLENFPAEEAQAFTELFAIRLDANPSRLDLIHIQARLKAQLEETEEAMRLLNKGLEIEPFQADLVVEKARLLDQVLNRPEDALNLVQASLQRNTDHRQLHAVQIQLLLKLHPGAVKVAVERAIDQADNDPQLTYYYALLLMENEQHTLARSLFNRLLAADPARHELNLYIGMIEAAAGNTEAAIAAFELVQTGDNLINAFNQTLALLEPGTEFERARLLLDRAMASDPDRADQLTVIFARWASDAGQVRAAVSLLSERLENDPENVSLLYSRALLSESIDPARMIADLELAYAIEPDNPATQNALGYSLLEHSEEFDRALALIEQALVQNPDDPAYLDSKGWALHKLGRNSEALDYLERAWQQMQDPEVGSHLIIVLSELLQTERAKSIFNQLWLLHPDNADLQEAQRWLEH